jgi:hypothetical protein
VGVCKGVCKGIRRVAESSPRKIRGEAPVAMRVVVAADGSAAALGARR